MSIKIKTSAVVAALFSILVFSGCGEKTEKPNHIRVGVIMGKELAVAEVAQKVAKEKYQLDVELVTFNDFVLPNESLDKGDIDVNAFQHRPYLEQQIKDRNYKLVAVGKTFIYPIAAYSKKIKSVEQLADGAQIAIPNDPTNLGRSLLLLQKQGLIKVSNSAGLQPTVLDITENPKKLNFIELEAPQLPRSLDDPKIVLAIINTTWASSAEPKLTPAKDGLFVEDKNSPYVNLIVSRIDNKDNENVKKFVKAYQSSEVAEAANKIFDGGLSLVGNCFIKKSDIIINKITR
ncbi:MetQ/NlpA family lipoprotein [Arsenophonus nasoniae]|uniref:Lipoprotein n=1 Tax=Arsenophonus nasoniae TaxID=638 RepID=A0AA95K3E8_9GAMM|nr:MetQ/NlpA family lipoprotein [Arsenophonus nasoniae]WGL94905.1 MetQ/NlpA family lipoprotein [Arsenophonus nasoniae]